MMNTRQRKAIKIEPELYDECVRVAEAQGVSMGDALRMCLRGESEGRPELVQPEQERALHVPEHIYDEVLALANAKGISQASAFELWIEGRDSEVVVVEADVVPRQVENDMHERFVSPVLEAIGQEGLATRQLVSSGFAGTFNGLVEIGNQLELDLEEEQEIQAGEAIKQKILAGIEAVDQNGFVPWQSLTVKSLKSRIIELDPKELVPLKDKDEDEIMEALEAVL